LAHEGGNSNSIAKEIFYNQKNIYTILERWSHAQMVTKMSEQKNPRYSLNRKKELLHAIGLKEMPNCLNWTRTFLLLGRLAKALSVSPWSDDEYLLLLKRRWHEELRAAFIALPQYDRTFAKPLPAGL
jgi:hypothetical protein